MPSNIKNISEKSSEMSTAKALYLLFRALPKKERIEAARYILEDEEIRYRSELFEIPNNTTLKSFAEDKTDMPKFHSIDDLRKDLIS